MVLLNDRFYLLGLKKGPQLCISNEVQGAWMLLVFRPHSMWVAWYMLLPTLEVLVPLL